MSPQPMPSTPRLSRRSALGHGTALGAVLGLVQPARTSAQDATPGAAAVTVERDVVYGEVDGQELLLDVTRPAGRETPSPAVVLFHGGAWTYGISGRMDMDLPAADLAAAGYVAFNVEYRLTGDPARAHVWPAQLDDAQRAVRWVRANAEAYGVDPERIGAYGHSAGAHLAALLGVRDARDDSDPALAGISSRVSAVVALAGHFDLGIPYPQEFDRQSVVALLGGTAAEVPDAYRDASPRTWVDAGSAAFLIMHGGADDMNPVEYVREMVVALQETEVETVYAEFPEADHFSIADWTFAGPWTRTFLNGQLQPED